jgi:hypothetical protein
MIVNLRAIPLITIKASSAVRQASVVAPRRLTSNTLLVIGNAIQPTNFRLNTQIEQWVWASRGNGEKCGYR